MNDYGMGFDFDEAVWQLEDLFDEADHLEDAELLAAIEIVLARCGADEAGDPEVVEAVATAAFNASYTERIGPLLEGGA